jgi:hypothetical protein
MITLACKILPLKLAGDNKACIGADMRIYTPQSTKACAMFVAASCQCSPIVVWTVTRSCVSVVDPKRRRFLEEGDCIAKGQTVQQEGQVSMSDKQIMVVTDWRRRELRMFKAH